MSFITENNETKTDYAEIKEQAKRRFVERLREFGRGFWVCTEEIGETDTKSFDGWL
ncbi:MAG: hypothetical protein HKN18_10280 [Silicimonas sp.]|nr:hypothetical protein [Silicimonas sp.]